MRFARRIDVDCNARQPAGRKRPWVRDAPPRPERPPWAKPIVQTEPGERRVDETLSRHVANEEPLLFSLTQAEQETLDALLKSSSPRFRVENSTGLSRIAGTTP